MLEDNYRPWGTLDWVIDRLSSGRKWSFLSCLSYEERSLAALEILVNGKCLNSVDFLNIKDPHSRFTKRIDELTAIHQKKFLKLSNSLGKLTQADLFSTDEDIVKYIDHIISSSGGNIILDISSFPKRFFFPFVKRILQGKVNNFIVTYTCPSSYSQQELAEKPGPWEKLPLFGPIQYPDPALKLIIVGIGYLALGLPDVIKSNFNDIDVEMLFPFPPGPPSYQRNWSVVLKLEKEISVNSGENRKEPIRVSAKDVSETFNHIEALTNGGQRNTLFAPFGPKPISLAMCLHAYKTGAPVFYTQPSVYNPDYSHGISLCNGKYETYAYCIKLNNKQYY